MRRRTTIIGSGVLCLAVIALTATLWPRTALPLDHRDTRRLVLYYTLQRFDDAVVILGDSITEAATLPREICGHPVVNAGLSGASTASDLGNWLSVALNGKSAALIVVALGTNDALVPDPSSDAAFAERYAALLAQIAPLAPRRVVVSIPPVQAKDRLPPDLAGQLWAVVGRYNALLPAIAARGEAGFVQIEGFPAAGTIDGVHLDVAGYRAWDAAIAKAASAVCG